MLRSAYFPIPHRPTFGAPVFRSAYSASRNARASAAFAASIKPYYGLCSKTLDLQPLCGLRKGTEGNLSVCCGSQLPLRRGAEGNPSVCCGSQPPLHSSHRLSSSSCAGVAVGLFSEKSTPYSFLQNARPSAALRPAKGSRGQPLSLLRQPAPLTFFAPTQFFELRRCCGRLIFRKEYTVLFSPKRSTFSRFAACEREPRATPQSVAATILLEKGS